MTLFSSTLRRSSLALLALAAFAARADSLWTTPGKTERSMFADRKAGGVGDILAVVVQENVAADTTSRTKSDNASSNDSAIKQFLFSPAASGLGTHHGELPGTKFDASKNFTGGGEVSKTQTLTSRTSVLVSDVLPNGNLVVQGVRVVIFSGEKQYVVLHGIVRPDDIGADNSVLSSNVADARLEFISEGELTDAQKKGWLTKLYDVLRPY